jgi:hypothetical protein
MPTRTQQKERWKEWNESQQDYSKVSFSVGDLLQEIDDLKG